MKIHDYEESIDKNGKIIRIYNVERDDMELTIIDTTNPLSGIKNFIMSVAEINNWNITKDDKGYIFEKDNIAIRPIENGWLVHSSKNFKYHELKFYNHDEIYEFFGGLL